jgi:DNA-binding NarL/FixJ family response regulator
MRRSDPDPTRPGHLGSNPVVRRLTEREHQVARLVAQGVKDASIARHLGLSASTVGCYVRHIQQRLKLSTRAAIAAWVTARLDPDNPTGRLRRLDPSRSVQGPEHQAGHE